MFSVVEGMSGDVSVLHVDDEPDVLNLSTQLFERTDPDVSLVTAGSGPAGMEALDGHDVDCIVSDSVRMPDGESFVEAASERTDAPIVLFTAKEWRDVAGDALAADVSEYVRKAGQSDYRTVIDHVFRLTDSSDETGTAENRRLIGRHDFSSSVELGVSIAEAVENVLDKDVTEFDPLYNTIDADTLERLLSRTAGGLQGENIEVHFSYEGLDLIVTAQGNVLLASRSN
jgi:CheY-like chemotaxis protein